MRAFSATHVHQHDNADEGAEAATHAGAHYSTEKTSVLLVLPSLQAGGTENYALRLISSAPAHHFTWHVMSIDVSIGDLHDDFQKLGVHIHYGGIGYLNPAKALRFYKFLKSNAIETMMTFNGVFGGLPLAIAHLAKVRRRIGWHRRSTPAFDPTVLRRLYARFSLALLERYSTKILSNSAAALENYHPKAHKTSRHFRVIPNGINVELFRDYPETKDEARLQLGLCLTRFIIGHVGRYDPAKNHQTIFEAAKALCARDPSATFLFCGKGTDSPEFKNELRRYGIQENCVHLGLQENMPRVYKSFDVFYFPSITEGQSNALIEAAVSGVPIVASNIPGNLSVIPERHHDKLVSPLDVNGSIRRIVDARKTPPTEIQAIQDWAFDHFGLKKNIQLTIKELT